MLDFMPVEDGFGEAVLPLGDLARTSIARRRGLPEMLDRVRNTLVNRLAHNRADAPPCLLVVNGLECPADESKLAHLEQIVREGPPSVYTLCCGGPRWTRSSGGSPATHGADFALRVVGPLDGRTSQTLIDSPAAASLRPHQTLLYDEFEARLVRSRPYAIPDAAWLANVRARWPKSRETAGVTLR